jgi:hypothetical protein
MLKQYQQMMLKFENSKCPWGYGFLQIWFGLRGPRRKILWPELAGSRR